MPHFDIGNRLAIYGWKKDTEDFYYFMAKVWVTKGFYEIYGNVEQLLFHPTTGSLPYVKEVRKETGLSDMPEQEILQTLNNLRKNKYLESHVSLFEKVQ